MLVIQPTADGRFRISNSHRTDVARDVASARTLAYNWGHTDISINKALAEMRATGGGDAPATGWRVSRPEPVRLPPRRESRGEESAPPAAKRARRPVAVTPAVPAVEVPVVAATTEPAKGAEAKTAKPEPSAVQPDAPQHPVARGSTKPRRPKPGAPGESAAPHAVAKETVVKESVPKETVATDATPGSEVRARKPRILVTTAAAEAAVVEPKPTRRKAAPSLVQPSAPAPAPPEKQAPQKARKPAAPPVSATPAPAPAPEPAKAPKRERASAPEPRADSARERALALFRDGVKELSALERETLPFARAPWSELREMAEHIAACLEGKKPKGRRSPVAGDPSAGD